MQCGFLALRHTAEVYDVGEVVGDVGGGGRPEVGLLAVAVCDGAGGGAGGTAHQNVDRSVTDGESFVCAPAAAVENFKYCFGRWLAFRYIVAANYHCEVMCYAEHVDVFVERGEAAAAGYGHSEAAAVEMAEGGQYARKTFD